MTRFYVAALAAAFALAGTAADAHTHLTNSTPAAGSSLKSSPTSIRMNFSEGVIPRFSGVVLKDGSGHAVPTGNASAAGSDNTQLTVPIKAQLRPGTYRVAWHAVATDTHRASGSYSFRITP